VHRTTFGRQASNLWKMKERLQARLHRQIDKDPFVSITDSFPVPVCRFARAYRCRRLAPEAAYGHDAMQKQTFYGLRGHVAVTWPGAGPDGRTGSGQHARHRDGSPRALRGEGMDAG
jgi:hypothetical protein